MESEGERREMRKKRNETRGAWNDWAPNLICHSAGNLWTEPKEGSGKRNRPTDGWTDRETDS